MVTIGLNIVVNGQLLFQFHRLRFQVKILCFSGSYNYFGAPTMTDVLWTFIILCVKCEQAGTFLKF